MKTDIFIQTHPRTRPGYISHRWEAGNVRKAQFPHRSLQRSVTESTGVGVVFGHPSFLAAHLSYPVHLKLLRLTCGIGAWLIPVFAQNKAQMANFPNHYSPLAPKNIWKTRDSPEEKQHKHLFISVTAKSKSCHIFYNSC